MNNKFIVTGASSGVGRAIAEALLKAGFQVIGISRHPERGPTAFEGYLPVRLDLSDIQTLPKALEDIVKQHPDLRGVVFNAGAGRFGSLEEFSYEQIQQSLNLNLTSQIYLARAVLPALKYKGQGDLIFIGSEAALNGAKRGSVYCASKFGLRGLAQSLRQECATRNIKTCIINPGMVNTGFFDELDFKHGDDPANYITPEDIAAAVMNVIMLSPGAVIDEINLSPLKKVVQPK
jgi:NADP-dependent 3-hydroxy acid dehydrogenase YdfG